jgi:hypothetical protein
METKKKAGLVILILSLAVLTLLARIYHEPAYPPITRGIHLPGVSTISKLKR